MFGYRVFMQNIIDTSIFFRMLRINVSNLYTLTRLNDGITLLPTHTIVLFLFLIVTHYHYVQNSFE